MALVLRQSRQGPRGTRGGGSGSAGVQYGLQADGSYTIPFGVEVVQKLVKWRRRAVGNLKKRRQAEARVMMGRDVPAAVELEEFWTGVNLAELQTFSLRELRIACASRDLDQIGTRGELIDRILQQQRRDLKRIARSEAFERLQRERLGEAKGAVYAFGQGYGPQVHSWDRCFVRNNLTVLQAMCGRGVVQVQVGFDSRVCLALCENGDVISFGAVRPQDWAPLGYPDSKERRARGNRREELHIASTAAGAALDAGQRKIAESMGGARQPLLPPPEDDRPSIDGDSDGEGVQQTGVGGQGNVVVARVPFGPGQGSDEDDGVQNAAENSTDRDGPVRSQTAPATGKRASRESGHSVGSSEGLDSGRRPLATADGPRVGVKDKARRASLARLVESSPPPRSAMSAAGRRASMTAPAASERLGNADAASESSRRGSGPLRPSSKQSLRDEDGSDHLEPVREDGHEASPSGDAGIGPSDGLQQASLAPSTDSGAGLESIEGEGNPEVIDDLDLSSLPKPSQLAAGEPHSSLHADTGKLPRPRSQGSLPPGVAEDGQAGRRGRGAQGLPPVEKEMVPTQEQLASDEPDHPDRGSSAEASTGLGQAQTDEGDGEEEGSWAVGGTASGIAQRVRGFSVSDSRMAERDRIVSQGVKESSAAVSRKRRARHSLAEVLLEEDRNASLETPEGNDKKKNSRRPSLGGPVGLEPLPAGEDDELGEFAVKEATAKKDTAEPLPTQPHYNRYGPQGAGNLPAGAINLPRRVPLTEPSSSLRGPGVEAAEMEAERMGDVAKGKGLHAINRSFAPPPGKQPLSPKTLGKLERQKQQPRQLPQGVDSVGWQRPPGAAAGLKAPVSSDSGTLVPPGVSNRENVISTHGGAHSVSAARVQPLNPVRAAELARNYVADADPRTRHKKENKRRRRRQSQAEEAERRKASKRGRNARGARAKRTSDAMQAKSKASDKLKAKPIATPVDIPWLTHADKQRWQRAGGNSTGQDALAARREARASLAAAEAAPMAGTFSGGSTASRGHGVQLMTRAKARSALLAMGAGTPIAGSDRTLANLTGGGKLSSVPSSSLGRGPAAGPIIPSVDQMPLSGQPYPGASKTGYAKAVTPRSALQHSLTLRGVASIAQEQEEAKAAGHSLVGHNTAVNSLDTKQISTSTSRKQLPPLSLPGKLGGASPSAGEPFVRDARSVPNGFEEDESDPYEAIKKGDVPQEKWWELTKGAREKDKITAETGMQLAVKAFSNQRLGFGERKRFDPTSWGGEQNYIDIERAVDADMRGYADFSPPTEVRELRGECVVQVAVSGQHAVAVTSGGDVFVFGAARQGVLGLGGDGRFHSFPFLMDTEEHLGLPAQGRVVCASVGSSHSAVVTSQGELLMFGSANFGRLGLGSVRNHGPRVQNTASQGRAGSRLPVAEGQSEAKGKGGALEGGYVSVPTPVPVFSLAAAVAAGGLSSRMRVLQVSCGAAHTVALTDKGVYSWGSADGGRLGIGSHGVSQAAAMAARSKSDRAHAGRRAPDPSTLSSRVFDVPQEVKALRGQVVIQVEAAAWHSAAVVQVPPLVEGGWLYVWGSGGVGQLGLGSRTRAEEPELVTALLENDVVVAETSLGRYHTAVLSTDGEVWTWGSNAANCLGRPASVAAEGNPAFTPMPGRVEGLREYGVGSAVSVACGDRCTIVSTAPYAPETWPEWRERDMTMLDAARERRGAMMDRATGGAQDDVLRMAVDRAKEERQKLLELNRDRPLCVLAPPTDGSVLGSQAEALGAQAVTKGKELDKRAKEREEAENGGKDQEGPPSSGRPQSTGRSATPSGGRRQAECTGFVARLFAPDKCDVCGHERRYHTLLRRVPPLEELVDRFVAEIEREEELEFEYDALRARRAATGAARAAQFARGSGRGASPQ